MNRTTPDGTRLLPDAPPGTFLGSGYGGRFAMVVMPELDLAAVWVGVHPEIDKRAWSPFSEVRAVPGERNAARTARGADRTEAVKGESGRQRARAAAAGA